MSYIALRWFRFISQISKRNLSLYTLLKHANVINLKIQSFRKHIKALLFFSFIICYNNYDSSELARNGGIAQYARTKLHTFLPNGYALRVFCCCLYD